MRNWGKDLIPEITQIVGVSVRKLNAYQYRITLPDTRFLDYWPITGTWGIPREDLFVRKNDRELIKTIKKMLASPQVQPVAGVEHRGRIVEPWSDPDMSRVPTFSVPLPDDYSGVANDRREKIDPDLPFLKERITL